MLQVELRCNDCHRKIGASEPVRVSVKLFGDQTGSMRCS
jgi:hypothetical protein